MSSAPASDSPLISDLLARIAPRAPSLLVTIWGDTIAPSDEAIWLGSLIRLVEAFGLNERVVRTAAFRLARDGWLQNRLQGRRSFYELATAGQHLTRAADARIYRAGPTPWQGEWLVLMLPPERSELPDKLRHELALLGFGTAAQGVFVRPEPDFSEVAEILDDFGLSDRAVALRGDSALMNGMGPVRALVARAWDLSAIDQGYQGFIRTFAPWLDEADALSGMDSFVLRTLLVHEFRRITLRDPMLPDTLISADWSGQSARTLAARLYRITSPAALTHARSILECRTGPLPNPGSAYYHRFGGL